MTNSRSIFEVQAIKSQVTLNSVDLSFDYKLFFKNYDVVVFEYQGMQDYISYNHPAFDILKDVLCSVYYQGGKLFFGLLDRFRFDSFEDCCRYLCGIHSLDEFTFYDLIPADFQSGKFSPYIILNLLMFALNFGGEKDKLDAYNLTGHLYAISKIIRNKENNRLIRSVSALDFCFAPDFTLAFDTTTFVNVAMLNNKLKSEYKDRPRYVLDKNKQLVRYFGFDKDNVLFLGNPFRKTNIPFLSLNTHFTSCKLGRVIRIVEMLNSQYSSFLKISFKTIDSKCLKYNGKLITSHCAGQNRMFENVIINLVDKTTDETFHFEHFPALCFDLKKLIDFINSQPVSRRFNDFWAHFDLELKSGDNILSDNNVFNVVVVDDDEFDKKISERKDDLYAYDKDAIVQHIERSTFEEAFGSVFDEESDENDESEESGNDGKPGKRCNPKYNVPSVFYKILYEGAIKQDIRNGRIRYFDWSALNYKGIVRFGMRFVDNFEDGTYKLPAKNKDYRYFFVDVYPDGALRFSEETEGWNLFDVKHSVEYDLLYKQFKQANPVDVTIRFPDGTINIISSSNYRSLGRLKDIKRYIYDCPNSKAIKKIKLKADRWRFDGLTGINVFNIGDEMYYGVGSKIDNFNGSLDRGVPLRKVSGVNGAPVRFRELIDTLAVLFVRTNEFTAYPFICKYLREWAYYKMRYGVDYCDLGQ